MTVNPIIMSSIKMNHDTNASYQLDSKPNTFSKQKVNKDTNVKFSKALESQLYSILLKLKNNTRLNQVDVGEEIFSDLLMDEYAKKMSDHSNSALFK